MPETPGARAAEAAPLTDEELFAAASEAYDALVRQNPKKAFEVLDHFEAILRDSEEHFPQLVAKHIEDEERSYLTLNNQEVKVISIDSAQRWTEADDDLDDDQVRFNYDSGAEFVGLIYAVDLGDGLQPVSLPRGWSE